MQKHFMSNAANMLYVVKSTYICKYDSIEIHMHNCFMYLTNNPCNKLKGVLIHDSLAYTEIVCDHRIVCSI